MRTTVGLIFLAFALTVTLGGCGGASSTTCVATEALFPETLVLDHAAAAPANRTSYVIGTKVLQGSCGVPQHLVGVTSLTVSDTADVEVGSDSGLATVTCVRATDGPVSVTAGTLTAQLTCK